MHPTLFFVKSLRSKACAYPASSWMLLFCAPRVGNMLCASKPWHNYRLQSLVGVSSVCLPEPTADTYNSVGLL